MWFRQPPAVLPFHSPLFDYQNCLVNHEGRPAISIQRPVLTSLVARWLVQSIASSAAVSIFLYFSISSVSRSTVSARSSFPNQTKAIISGEPDETDGRPLLPMLRL